MFAENSRLSLVRIHSSAWKRVLRLKPLEFRPRPGPRLWTVLRLDSTQQYGLRRNGGLSVIRVAGDVQHDDVGSSRAMSRILVGTFHR